jgi:hypothetical protein
VEEEERKKIIIKSIDAVPLQLLCADVGVCHTCNPCANPCRLLMKF